MPKIKYIQHDGTEHDVDVPVGNSVMQGAVDNLIDGIVAECGGACACATCHCFVNDAWLEKAGAANEMEQEMLDSLLESGVNSRLSCQITISEELDGLIVRLPESQY